MSKARKNNKDGRKKTSSNRQADLKRSKQSKRPESASFQPSPFSAESRKKRDRERRRSLLMSRKPLIFLAIVASILVVITLLALVPGFTINQIEVNGTYRIDDKSVEQVLSSHKNKHFVYKLGGNIRTLFGLRYASAEETILASSPLVEDVKVYFSYPSRIKIDLNEKTEIMCVRVPGGYALVDKDLFVIELKEEASDIFPSVEQITLTETAEEGKQLQTEQTYRLQKSINLTAEIIRQDSSKKNEEKLLPLIRHIIWQDTSSFYLHIPSTQGGMIRVKLDDNRYLQDKLALLSDLIFVEGFTEKAAGELDMTGAKVHFRPDIS